jgi:stage II sporulation protein D
MKKTFPLLISGVGIALACASVAPASEGADPVFNNDNPAVRIALATTAKPVSLSGTGKWRIYNRSRESYLMAANAAEVLTVQQSGGQLRASRADGKRTEAVTGPLLVRALTPDGLLSFNGKRYRGELLISSTDSGMLVINRLPMEQYLRGVVPLEIGKRPREELAAMQAQAVAARSYSYSHIGSGARAQTFDMYATVMDQVYGGVDAEAPVTDEAVETTSGMVLKYAGRVLANTPYHSTCGGSTAPVSEVWYKEPDLPYLRAVSDRIPGTDSFYCDRSGRFRWTQTFSGDQLRANLEKYLANYTTAPKGDLGNVRMVRETGRTPSDRVRALEITTDRGTYTLRGNDIRFVMRDPSGAILNSTYFSTDVSVGSGGVQQLTLKGGGYGHGIGMCQFGAMGRARAGQSYRTILTTYYPGTSVEKI